MWENHYVKHVTPVNRKLHYYSVLVIKINWSLLIDYSKLIFVSCFANKIYLRWGTRNQPISFLSSSIVCTVRAVVHRKNATLRISSNWTFNVRLYNHRHFSYFKHSKVKLISFRQFADIKGSLVLKVVLCRQQWKRRNAFISQYSFLRCLLTEELPSRDIGSLSPFIN